jgi:hypothetical protein
LHIKNNILIEVAKSEWLYKASKTISPLFHDDLAQHLLLILCEMPEDKLIVLHQNNVVAKFNTTSKVLRRYEAYRTI